MQNAKIHQNRSAAPSKARAAIAKLQALLVRAPTEAIVAYASATLVSIDTIKKANAFGLGSPYRQAYFLLGLLSASPELVEPHDLTPSEYADLPPLLDAAFSAYTEEILVHERDGRPLTADEERDIEIAGPEFIKHHMTGRLAVFEQIEERIRGVFSPLDQKMRAAVGFTALEAIEIMKWIVDEVVRRLDEHGWFNDELRSAWKQWRTTARVATSLAELESGPAFERAKAAAQAAHDTLRTMNAFSRSDLRARFGATGDAFLARFVSRRGDNPGFRSVTDRNPVRYAPLFAIDGEFVVLPLANALYEGVYDALVAVGAREIGAPFFKARSRYVERRLGEVIRNLFPPSANVLYNCYETADLHHEHDVVVLHERALYVFEAKGTPPIEPPTDVRSAAVRLRRAFADKDRGIQKGFGQARHLLDRLLHGGEIVLYGANRLPVLRISPKDVDESFAIVVTADDFGLLAVDLSILLEKHADCPYPWVVNLFDFETLIDAFHAREWSVAEFKRFLAERALLHGRVFEADELAVAGAFVTYGSFRHFKLKPNEKYMFKGADVFDDLYLAKHGGPSVTFDQAKKPVTTDFRTEVEKAMRHRTARHRRKVGRNERCLCGSTLKYKKCCGRP
jgi:hypothetical protein